MSVVRLIVVISGKIIKEMPGSVTSGTPYIYIYMQVNFLCNTAGDISFQSQHQTNVKCSVT